MRFGYSDRFEVAFIAERCEDLRPVLFPQRLKGMCISAIIECKSQQFWDGRESQLTGRNDCAVLVVIRLSKLPSSLVKELTERTIASIAGISSIGHGIAGSQTSVCI